MTGAMTVPPGAAAVVLKVIENDADAPGASVGDAETQFIACEDERDRYFGDGSSVSEGVFKEVHENAANGGGAGGGGGGVVFNARDDEDFPVRFLGDLVGNAVDGGLDVARVHSGLVLRRAICRGEIEERLAE